MKLTSIIKKFSSYSLKRTEFLNFRIIVECMKHSNNHRETLTLHKYVNNDNSAKVMSLRVSDALSRCIR